MITVGYLARHAGRRPGDRDIDLLDVCQDYALELIQRPLGRRGPRAVGVIKVAG
jgi:hypothetical protein